MQKSGNQSHNRRLASRHRRITLESEGEGNSAPRRSSKYRSDNRPLHSSLPPNLNVMKGGKKSVVYKKGMGVLYKGPNGLVPARILDCHFDDLLEPYYTILREDGVEKQTDNDHLCMYPEPVVKQSTAIGPEYDDGIRVMASDEQRQQRKKAGLCPTCGQVQTHKQGLWRSRIPDTVEGLVYKGVCLKCTSIGAAKLNLGEPLDNRPGLGRGSSIQLKRPSLQVKHNAQSAQKGSSSRKLLRSMSSGDNHKHKRKSMTPAFLRRSTTGATADIATESQSPTPPDPSESSPPNRVMRHRSAQEVLPLDDLPDTTPNRELSPRRSSARRRPQNRNIQQQTLEERMIRRRSSQEVVPLDNLPDTTPNNELSPRRSSSRRRPQNTQQKTIEEHMVQNNDHHSDSSSQQDEQSSDSDFGYGQRETLVRNNRTTSNEDEGMDGMVKSDENSVVVVPPQSNQSAQLAVIVPKSQAPSNRNGRAPNDDQWKCGQTLRTEPNSAFSESIIDESNFTMEHNDPNRNEVVDFRCRDSSGQYGFYSGTIAKTIDGQQHPHGNGEMIYDEGSIVKGTWSMGALRARVPAEHERYEPFQLPNYRVGDVGHKYDIVKSSPAAISMLHIGDCCFVRRSNGSWTYSVLVSRIDSEDAPTLVLRVKPRGSTKTISKRQWSGHVRLAARPDILDWYKVGEAGNESDMVIAGNKETVKQVAKLRVGDAAFVRRSNGSWSYSFVIQKAMEDDGGDGFITFEVNQSGCTKTIQISQSAGSVCRIRQKKPSQRQRLAAVNKEDGEFNFAQDTESLVLADPGNEDRQEAVVQLEPEGNCINTHAHDNNNRGNPLKSSSFLDKAAYSQKLQGIYQELDEEDQSCNRQEPEPVLAIYDNRHHNCDNEDLALTDDACSSLDGYNSLTDASEADRIKDALMKSLVSRRRRQASQGNLTDEDSIADSTSERLVRHITRDGSLERSWESYKQTRKETHEDSLDEKADEGYLSNHNLRAHDSALLVNLLARATLEQTQHADGDASIDNHSLNESIASITESFLEWRKQKKRDKKTGDKKHKKKKHREKKSSKRRKEAQHG